MSGTGTRIALFAHRLAVATPTGINRYAIELTRALADLDVGSAPTQWIACAPREAADPTWLPANVRAASVRGPRRAMNLAWAVAGRPRLEKLIGEVDLVHVLAPVLPVPTARPLVVTVHDVMPITHPQWYTPRERWLNGAALRQAARDAQVITPSTAVADEVVRVLGADRERVTVVAEGVSVPPPPTPVDRASVCGRYGVDDGKFLLFIGAISPRKNLPVLLHALAGLAGDHPDLVLLAVGPHPPDAGSTLEVVEQLRLGDRVRFPGFVPDEDLHVLLASALALVHPSSYEGFGLTPLEAMASGTPVVSSDAGSLPEVVADAGILVPPQDPDAWREALRRLLSDEELRRRLSDQGRRRAAGFTWQQAAQQTLSVYQRALAR